MTSFSVSMLEAIPGSLTIGLVGSVDAGNAHEMEEGIASLRKEDPQARLTLDAQDLNYISSAGLRVVMRLLKQLGSVSITNASSEVYDVFEMTGLTELIDVRRAPREISVEG